MRKFIKYKVIGLALLVFAAVACDTASQDVSPIVEPSDSYPMVTYTPISNTTIAENDTVVLFTITIDKPIDRALTFRPTQTGGTATAEDYKITNATIAPWTTQAQVVMITTEGWAGEGNETAEFLVQLTSIADKYLLHPDATKSASVSVTITNNPYAVIVYCNTTSTTKDGTVSLYFDGDVSPVSGKKITLVDRGGYSTVWPNLVIDAADLVLEDGEFVVEHPDFIEWTAIRMTVDSGAFVDDQGNVNKKTVFNISVPFVMASYAGEYQWIYDPADADGDTIEVEVLDADNYILAVPDADGGLVDYMEVKFDLDNYLVRTTDVRTDYYLIYYDGPETADDGLYFDTEAYYSDTTVLEASQLLIRDASTGFGYFDELTFEYGFIYEVYGDLMKGDGSYHTSGNVWGYVMEYAPITGEKTSKVTATPVNRRYAMGEEVILNGRSVRKAEIIK
ncbi:MAG: hypothetical protein RBT49_04475 [Bacteroidales bacterium]|jgi:hypothetical protein|nr:hypothetical protein [Bacteroidales bacterium]